MDRVKFIVQGLVESYTPVPLRLTLMQRGLFWDGTRASAERNDYPLEPWHSGGKGPLYRVDDGRPTRYITINTTHGLCTISITG
jgi:hypothetical protein